MMNNTTEALLREAFIQAFSEKYEEKLSICNTGVECSEKHKKRIRKIINSIVTARARKYLSKKTVLVLLLAAALLLLAGCTAYVYREQIGNFFLEVFDGYALGRFENKNDENVCDITEVYCVGYLPDGYVLRKEVIRSNRVTYTWKNESEEIISFDQKIYDAVVHYVDIEKSRTENFKHLEYTVYVILSDYGKTYLWDNGEYIFTLKITQEISKEEVSKIIESICVKQ